MSGVEIAYVKPCPKHLHKLAGEKGHLFMEKNKSQKKVTPTRNAHLKN